MSQAQVSPLSQVSGATIPASSIAQATQATGASVKYVLMNRPAAGRALFAHTAAVMQALGLFEGASVKRSTLVRVWGERAVKYHAGKFQHAEDGLALNDEGFSVFGEFRTVDPEQSAMFFEMLTTGKVPADCPTSFKAIKPI